MTYGSISAAEDGVGLSCLRADVYLPMVEDLACNESPVLLDVEESRNIGGLVNDDDTAVRCSMLSPPVFVRVCVCLLVTDVREGHQGHAVEGHRAQQRHRGEPDPQGGDPRAPGRDRGRRQGMHVVTNVWGNSTRTCKQKCKTYACSRDK